MAMNEVTHVGYTVAGVDNLVDGATGLSANRIIGDTKNQNDTNSKLIDLDGNNKDLTDRNEDALALMNTAISENRNSRYTKCGLVASEPTPAGENLTTKINTNASYFAEKSSVFAGIESAETLTAKNVLTDEKHVENQARIDTLLTGTNITNDSFKELYDNVMGIDVNDPDTPAGFEFSMRKEISKLADQGDQKRGNCLVYKDENSKSFYEMYIQGGLIALEEIPNPDKDVILSYLNDTELNYSDLGTYINTTSLKLDDNRMILIHIFDLRIYLQLFISDVTRTIITMSPFQTSFDIGSYDAFNAVFNSTNNILTVTANVRYDGSNTWPTKIINFNIINDVITLKTDSTLEYTNDNQVKTFKYGSYATDNYIVCSNLSKYVNIYTKSSGILFTTIDLGLDRFIPGSENTQNIYCDDTHVFVSCLTDIDTDPKVVIKKYLIADQSLVATYNTGMEGLHKYSSLKIINNNVLVYCNTHIKKFIFINKNTMTEYTDTNADFGPIASVTEYINNVNGGYNYISDLGNSKLLIKSYAGEFKIYTYDGYEIFRSTSLGYTVAFDEHVVIDSGRTINIVNEQTINTVNTHVKSKPIYKYK